MGEIHRRIQKAAMGVSGRRGDLSISHDAEPGDDNAFGKENYR